MVEVHAVDRGRGFLPRLEERAFDPTLVPSEGAARKGSRDGGVLGVRAVGHPETPASAASPHHPETDGERSRRCAAALSYESSRFALYTAKRRCHPPHY